MSHEAAVKQAYVLGSPIEHSLSPQLHRIAYRFLDVDMGYERLETTVEDLPLRFAPQMTAEDLGGYSVTMPLKEAIFNYVDVVSPFAMQVGAINTVYWTTQRDGQRFSQGHNTDVAGILNALDSVQPQAVAPLPRAIIGGGSTATSALVALKVLGSHTVDVYVRNTNRTHTLLQTAAMLKMTVNVRNLADFVHHAQGYTTVICTLPAHAADTFASHLSQPIQGTLLDVSYNPWPSTLAHQWEKAGGAVVSGLFMLLYQAVDQVKLFNGYLPSHRFDQESELINSMAAAIGLENRDYVPQFVIDPQHTLND